MTAACHDGARGGPPALAGAGAVKGLVERDRPGAGGMAWTGSTRCGVDLGRSARCIQPAGAPASLSAEFEARLAGTCRTRTSACRTSPTCFRSGQRPASRHPADGGHTNYTPDLMRQFDDEQRRAAISAGLCTPCTAAMAGLAGITEVYWNPNRPRLLWQGFTGVAPTHRGRGLGRWLKAEMLPASCTIARRCRSSAPAMPLPTLPCSRSTAPSASSARGLVHLAGGAASRLSVPASSGLIPGVRAQSSRRASAEYNHPMREMIYGRSAVYETLRAARRQFFGLQVAETARGRPGASRRSWNLPPPRKLKVTRSPT